MSQNNASHDNIIALSLDINKEITDLNQINDIRRLLKIIVEKSPKIVNADRASVFFLDRRTHELWTLAASGLSDDQEIRVSTSRGIVGHVYTSQQILNIPHAYSDSRFNPAVDRQFNYQTQNILCAPIFNRTHEVIGVLELMNKLDGAFTTKDEDLITMFCDQVAIAVENVMLYEELKASYDALKRTQEQLINSEKLAVVGKVAAGIAHEIKNQMVGLSFAELIKAKYPQDEKIQEYAETILGTKNHMLSILNELRDFAQNRETAYLKSEHSLAEMIEKLVSFMQFDPDIRFHRLTTAYHAHPVVTMNQEKIKQMLINIIRNAAHAIGYTRKGTISIELLADETHATIKVSDDGSGIPAENIDKIWEPFYTTKDSSKGTGLGLDLCRRIIEGHGGRIYCESVIDQGSTFFIVLPLLEQQSPGSPQ